jgi:F0F1-type ATP synthase assembly protein I
MLIFVGVLPASVLLGMEFHRIVDKYVESHNTWYMIWVLTLATTVLAFVLTVWRWCLFG